MKTKTTVRTNRRVVRTRTSRARSPLSPKSNSHQTASPSIHTRRTQSGPGATEATPHPAQGRDPSNTEMLGGPSSSGSRRDPVEKDRRRHTRQEPSTSASKTGKSCRHRTASPRHPHEAGTVSSSGQPKSPSAPGRGRDPTNTEVPGGHVVITGHEKRHRGTDDGDTLERAEHAIPTHRRIEQPQDRFPERPPRQTSVKDSRQPRSPLTPAQGSRPLQHRGAGRATFNNGS